jgi:hypothetical protein
MTYYRAMVFAVLLSVAGIAVSPPQAAAGVRLGGISVGGGYARGLFYPPYYGFGPYPWASPFWSGSPWLYSGYSVAPEGKILLQHTAPDALVYIDDGYAGEAAKLKSLRLQPGVYNLEVRSVSGNFQRRIYVLSGKTLKIDTRRQP